MGEELGWDAARIGSETDRYRVFVEAKAMV
jgi:hypothetical protein